MADIFFKCRACEKCLVVDDSGAGTQINCPDCGAFTLIPGTTSHFECPSCKGSFNLSSSISGEGFKCPNCKTVTQVQTEEANVPRRTCPSCLVAVGQDAIICVNCGLNLKTGMTVKSSVAQPLPGLTSATRRTKIPVKILITMAVIAVGCYGAKLVVNKFWNNQQNDAAVSSSGVKVAPANSFDFFDSEADARADSLYPRFEYAVHAGDIDLALSLQHKIASFFTKTQGAEQFWSKHIPVDKQRMLVFASICEDCRNGLCSACNGAKTCSECKGEKKCPVCFGKGGSDSRCRSGICDKCDGHGNCRACNGARKIKCGRCGGGGQVDAGLVRTTCPRCGGKKRIMQLGSDMMCANCAGKGYFETRKWGLCGACAGKGIVDCSACGGTGVCLSCNGTGHNPHCAYCGGTGIIHHKCAKCSGQGICSHCDGLGVCPRCEGEGKCHTCQGHGVKTCDSLLVDAQWIKLDKGFIVYGDLSSITASSIGYQTLECFGRDLVFRVAERELWCISVTNDFTFVKSVILR